MKLFNRFFNRSEVAQTLAEIKRHGVVEADTRHCAYYINTKDTGDAIRLAIKWTTTLSKNETDLGNSDLRDFYKYDSDYFKILTQAYSHGTIVLIIREYREPNIVMYNDATGKMELQPEGGLSL